MDDLNEILNFELIRYKDVSVNLLDIGMVISIFIATAFLLKLVQIALIRRVRNQS